MTKAKEIPDIADIPGHYLLTRGQVAAVSNFTQQSLKMWANEGRGPKCRKIEGRYRYRADDVREWLKGQTE